MVATMCSSSRKLFFIPLAAILTVAGCSRGARTVNYRVALRTPARPGIETGQARESIRRALLTNRWQVVLDDPGAFTATYSEGPHAATIRVSYDAQTYSIEHQSSSASLRFDGTYIHPRYNGWIRDLHRQIETELDRSAS